MKKLLFLIALFCASITYAQDYLISFIGTGASSTVSTVKVENLTAGTTLNLNGNDILRLTGATGVNPIMTEQSSKINIYPNPMTASSTLETYPPTDGNATISIYEITGKIVFHFHCYLENSRQEFRLTGLKNGFYLINVSGNKYQLSGKLLSYGEADRIITLEKVENFNKTIVEKPSKLNIKGALSTVDMPYSAGDRLKFTGTSGNYSTVITDIPAQDKTITFNFISCTDGDNNNYTVVVIGTQTWMAENLKTTKYKNGIDNIPLVTDNTIWSVLITPGYCWYNNQEATYKNTYGALYNWYTVNTGNLCPTGWHAPIDSEWTSLENYLIANGYNYDGTTTANKIAKALASTTLWASSANTGVVGNTDYPAKRNATGFTALPGGTRTNNGTFHNIWSCGDWWSASELDATYAWPRYLLYDYSNVYIYFITKNIGLSVRCLRD